MNGTRMPKLSLRCAESVVRLVVGGAFEKCLAGLPASHILSIYYATVQTNEFAFPILHATQVSSIQRNSEPNKPPTNNTAKTMHAHLRQHTRAHRVRAIRSMWKLRLCNLGKETVVAYGEHCCGNYSRCPCGSKLCGWHSIFQARDDATGRVVLCAKCIGTEQFKPEYKAHYYMHVMSAA